MLPLPRDVLNRRRENRVRASLHYSMIDGVFAAVMVGWVEAYIVPFGLALHATPAQIGHLAAVPALIAALMQLHAPYLSATRGRKTTFRAVVGLQALSLMLLTLVPFLPLDSRFPLLLGLISCYMIFNSLASPLYGSLLAEYLPLTRRSGYFGRRNRVLGCVTVAGSFIAGIVLDAFGKQNVVGFALLFLGAGFCRLLSRYYMGFLHEPETDRRNARMDAPPADLGPSFIRFVLFAGLLMGAVNVAAPFFPVHALNDLGFSYRTYTLLVIGSQATMFYLMAIWGREADRIGNLTIIKTVSALMPVLPLLWTLFNRPWALLIAQILGGGLWAGYNLCVTNFIYDAVPSSQRVRATVLFNISTGVCSFIGAFLGGQLFAILPSLHGSPFITLALLSAVLQGVILLYFIPRLREVRAVPHTRSVDLFYSVLNIRPVFAAIRDGMRFAARD